VVALTFLIIYLPIITLVVFSFNDSKRNIVWRGFTTKYYEKAWNNPSLFEAFTNSLVIARVTGFPTDWIWPLNLSAIIAAHVAFTFPFVAIVVRARLSGFNRELEDASKDLGASEWQTFWNIVFP